MIEKGRHLKVKNNLRFCPLCPNQDEDEMHFLQLCEGYKKEREKLFLKANQTNRGFIHLHNMEKLNFLLKNNDLVRTTAQFIWHNLE